MKEKSLVKNALYNFVYTGLNLFFPIITAPYISRVLGASNLGKVNFATSLVNWFILCSVFGISSYGVREVAKVRNNKTQLSKLFSELLLINFMLSIIMTVVYLILVLRITRFQDDLMLYLVMSINILLNMFSIDWLFQGIEEYRYITIRGFLIKLISLFSIFIFVREIGDYVIYGMISVFVTGLGNIINYLYSKRIITVSFNSINLSKHFNKLSVFFIHSLIVNIYTNLDQTMLGFLSTTSSVAFMNRSRTIIGAASSVANSISNVTMPRASYYIKHDKDRFNGLLSTIPRYILIITIPLTMGIIILSSNTMYALGGPDFLEGEKLLKVLSLLLIFAPLSSYLQNQVLIPTGNEKLGLFCAFLSSFISIGLNLLFIPRYGYMGAGYAACIAEFVAVSTRYYIVRYKLEYKNLRFFNKSVYLYFFSSIIMGTVVIYVNTLTTNYIISLFICTSVGLGVYLGILIMLKEQVTISTINAIRNKFRK